MSVIHDSLKKLQEKMLERSRGRPQERGGEEKTRAYIQKRRIRWEPVLEATSYVVYVSRDRTIFDPEKFRWEATHGVIFKIVIGKTELILPDGWPEFPTEPGTYYVGITSKDDMGNQSDPFLSSGPFKFLAPPPPPKGGIESL